MIDFEMSPGLEQIRGMIHGVAEMQMRPIAREYDEEEHKFPGPYVEFMHSATKMMGGGMFGGEKKEKKKEGEGGEKKERRRGEKALFQCVTIEQLAWGDAGLYLCTPSPGLGGFAIDAVGTPEQKERFLARFAGDEPCWGAMAITEPNAGSDSAAIRTTAVREDDEWVINGTKIFVTMGHKAIVDSKGFVVVWATVDPKAGRAGIKSFVVEAGTKGMKLIKVEHKLGIRASDTAQIVFDNCRIPLGNILGSPEVVEKGEGFKGAMATFDASRPVVSASGVGVAQAALDAVKEALKEQGIELPYGKPRAQLTSLQRDVMWMEAQVRATRWLAYKSAWMVDQGKPNALEASTGKAKAGKMVTKVTQKAVEILGPLGYSRKYLFEKWMRDAKITDIYEGTQQINLLIVARRILDYSSSQLR